MKKNILIFSVLALLSIFCVIVIHLDGVRLMYECRSFKVDEACVIKKVDQAIDEEPKEGAEILIQLASLRRLSLLGGDFRVYSSSLHRLGHVFFMKGYFFEDIDLLCPALIKDGCIHGYVMEFINHNNIEAGAKLCDTSKNTRVRLGCIHALGHSYLEFNEKPIKQANQSFCNSYSNLEYAACVSGTFHEYSKFGTGMGHENYYQRPHEYQEIDCSNFTGEEYTLCYGSIGSFRQYFPESETIELTYKVCDLAKTGEAKKLCKYNARQRLDIARGYSFVDFN